MNKLCFECDLKQMKKISQFLDLDKAKEEELIAITKNYLTTCDMSKTNPEIMAEIWHRITPVLKTDNPYEQIKNYYNQLVLGMFQEIKENINRSNNKLETGLKMVICGNLIDFAAKHKFDEASFRKLLENVENILLAINDSKEMFTKIKESKSLLYLGDNCGEIALDKCFISLLQEYQPELKVYYGVRGRPIVNDVTLDDAHVVGMDEVATVISNGDGSLGTVLKRTSLEFQTIFNQVDVVICKGQGNYEGLLKVDKEEVYFLFMAKCELVARPLDVATMSIVCMKNNKEISWGKLD